jgi:hypothetical protein
VFETTGGNEMRILPFLPVGAILVVSTACGRATQVSAEPDPLGVLVADVQQKDVPLYLVKQEHTEGAFVREGQLFFQVEQIRKAGISTLAGLPPPKEMLVDLARLEREYFARRPDLSDSNQMVDKLRRLSPNAVKESSLAGEPIVTKLTRARGNNAPMSGLKVNNSRGWFAARPSGTENACKIYAESFDSEEHLNRIFDEAHGTVDGALEQEGRA